MQDWARNHSGDPEIEAASKRGDDAGVALVSFICFNFSFIHLHLFFQYIDNQVHFSAWL